jgi:hypothetical protein
VGVAWAPADILLVGGRGEVVVGLWYEVSDCSGDGRFRFLVTEDGRDGLCGSV